MRQKNHRLYHELAPPTSGRATYLPARLNAPTSNITPKTKFTSTCIQNAPKFHQNACKKAQKKCKSLKFCLFSAVSTGQTSEKSADSAENCTREDNSDDRTRQTPAHKSCTVHYESVQKIKHARNLCKIIISCLLHSVVVSDKIIWRYNENVSKQKSQIPDKIILPQHEKCQVINNHSNLPCC